MIIEIITFQQALDKASSNGKKKQLLLGNGFSIECHDAFKYKTLVEEAERNGLPLHLMELLIRYRHNFEDVLKNLDEGAFLAGHYGLLKPNPSDKDMNEDYEKLKNILVETISKNHPATPGEISGERFEICLSFLKNFEAIFTVNYDLLLYWASLHINEDQGDDFPFRDGFGREDDPENPDCSFQYASMEGKPYIFFLHGALHLHTKEGHVWKFVWNTSGIPILQRVKEAFENKNYPLVVTEGTPEEKMEKIESSSYLSQAYRKFINIQGNLFIFGHSLSNQDDHLVNAIIHSKGKKLTYLWVGIYGEPTALENKAIIEKVLSIQSERERILSPAMKRKNQGHLNIAFFDSQTAKVWQ